MSDKYTETTNVSWTSRIGDSIKGVIIGVALFIASIALIFTNEGRSIDRIKTLGEGRGLVVSVSSEKVDSSNDNSLIHISGKANTENILTDKLFGVSENALKLRRNVAMYQWQEKEKTKITNNSGGDQTKKTVYSYEKKWLGNLVDSSRFKVPEGHENPTKMPFTGKSYVAENIKLGAFNLTKPFKNKIKNFNAYELTDKNYNLMDKRLKKYFKLSGNEYFYGDQNNPQVGAVRVNYSIIYPTQISAIGKQNNNSLETYFTKKGKINLLEHGNLGAESMFVAAESKNSMKTWAMRLVAFLLMGSGISMILKPIKVISDFVPFIGNVVGIGIAVITFFIAFPLTLFLIAISWIFVRPLMAVPLLVVAIGTVIGGLYLKKNKSQNYEHKSGEVKAKS